ncbi:lysine-sensitive aspartokinase 3 [Idiomarina sp. UBA3162]|uniref:lysine-sensitive aspartokinase 3 n=1 Tax=Idiomarina sp. UBA3162 TaxID=1946641 RepID=UPI000C91B563|nr:lysine-sensitive aspartokinase 3 [Idiomarina sp. UBA3162]MAD54982.1 lysine-sensitive aspartokinase 3 [Idiomarinaceae bacterium]
MNQLQNNLSIAKFGGTSVATYDAISAAVANVQQQTQRLIVVVSACGGVTDALVKIAHMASNSADSLAQIEQRHQTILSQVSRLRQPRLLYWQTALECIHADLRQHLEERPGETSTRFSQWRDRLLSFGERCSSLLFCAVWEEQTQTMAEVMTAETWLVTDERFGHARPNMDATRTKTAQQLLTLNSDIQYVTQGFIGATEAGLTTTLGRGGSDYSAALLAVATGASEVQIWTDVAGVYSTDPRLCKEAFPIPEMSFDEAAEMATFGAKVLHPASLIPAIEHNIPVFVGHSQFPERGGTRLVKNTVFRPDVRAIAVRKKQTLMTVHSIDMFHASGFLAKLFGIFAKYDISVDLITTSEVSIALTLDEGGSQANNQVTLPSAAIDEIEAFARVELEQDLSLVALIGNQIGRQSQLSQWVFDAVSPTPVRMICQGASAYNLCFLIPSSDTDSVVNRLHERIKR